MAVVPGGDRDRLAGERTAEPHAGGCFGFRDPPYITCKSCNTKNGKMARQFSARHSRRFEVADRPKTPKAPVFRMPQETSTWLACWRPTWLRLGEVDEGSDQRSRRVRSSRAERLPGGVNHEREK